MPFLAFDFDALDSLPDTARAAGVDEAVVALGLLRTWRWCWRTKTDTITRAQIRGFFGHGEMVEALVAFGFLETIGDVAFRVRGAERYLRIRAAQSAGGKTAKGNLKQRKRPEVEPVETSAVLPAVPEVEPVETSGASTALTASIKQLASNTTYVRSTCGAAPEAPPPAAPPPEAEQRRPVAPVTPPETPPSEWDGWDFWRWAQSRREASGYLPERPPHPRKLSAWWSEALGLVSEAEVLKEAFYRFGDDKFWAKADPPYPFGGFMTQWERFAPPKEVDE